MEELLARLRNNESATASEVCINFSEAERIAKSLKEFDLKEVGNSAWMEHHDFIEKLNMQAHLNAQHHSDEFVKEALVTLDKTTLLVKDLLLTEVWKDKVLPLLGDHLAKTVDSLSSYILLYHETSLANLLEDACESISEDSLCELCDWCCRKLVYLTAEACQHCQLQPESSMKDMLSQTPLQDLELKKQEVDFNTALCALTILRYLTEHMEKVSLGLMSRLVTTNDVAFGILPLLDRPPWVRRGKKGIEKYINGRWQAVEPRDRLRLTQQDGQVWLALYNLLVDPACRAKMNLTGARCDSLFKLKRFFSDLLLDQLPVLKDLQRVIDELAFGASSVPVQPTSSRAIIVEQVPMIRAALLQRTDWAEVAEHSKLNQFGPSSRHLSQERLQSMLKAIDLMGDMEEGKNAQQVATGPPVSLKLEAYRSVKEGVWEWWATYILEVDVEKLAEPISTTAAPAMAPQQECTQADCGPAGDENKQPPGSDNKPSNHDEEKQEEVMASTVVKGMRYRLRPLSENLQRALPSQGKLSVLVSGHTCQASVELPVSETRNTTDLPPSIWLTVGSLSRDGLALQLKLKRLSKPTERDQVLGVWFPYVPVAGALSIQDGLFE